MSAPISVVLLPGMDGTGRLVLSIAGSQDRLNSARNRDDLRALGERIESVVLDAPHLVLQRQPAAAARIIDEYLRRKIRNSAREIDTDSDKR